MADNKSSEENILYQCLECNRHRVIKNGIDGSSCSYCDGYLKVIGPTNLPTSKEGKKTIHYGGITITADVSDALKGLKAVQREARKASAALKELEEQQNKDKYFVIELDALGNNPRVFYKGKEITKKEYINFQWTTSSNVPGNTEVIVDYFDTTDGVVRKSIREGVSS